MRNFKYVAPAGALSVAVLLAGCGGSSPKAAASSAGSASTGSSSTSSSSTTSSSATPTAQSSSAASSSAPTAGSTSATTSSPSKPSSVAIIPTLVAGVPQTEGGRLVGLGTTRPSEIDLGWNATNRVSGISWSSWGGETAQGVGSQAEWTAGSQADAKPVKTYVTLYRGTCGGKLVYRYMATSYTGFAQNSQGQSVDLCHLDGATPG